MPPRPDLAHDLVASDHARYARQRRLLGDVLRPTNVLPSREPVPSPTDAFSHQFSSARHRARPWLAGGPVASPRQPTSRPGGGRDRDRPPAPALPPRGRERPPPTPAPPATPARRRARSTRAGTAASASCGSARPRTPARRRTSPCPPPRSTRPRNCRLDRITCDIVSEAPARCEVSGDGFGAVCTLASREWHRCVTRDEEQRCQTVPSAGIPSSSPARTSRRREPRRRRDAHDAAPIPDDAAVVARPVGAGAAAGARALAHAAAHRARPAGAGQAGTRSPPRPSPPTRRPPASGAGRGWP